MRNFIYFQAFFIENQVRFPHGSPISNKVELFTIMESRLCFFVLLSRTE